MEKNRLSRIEDKLDKLDEKMQEISITLAENTQSLIIHEKRTDLAEKKLELVQVKINEQNNKEQILLEKIDKKLEPIKTHVNIINVIFVYVIPSIAALILFLSKLGVLKF